MRFKRYDRESYQTYLRTPHWYDFRSRYLTNTTKCYICTKRQARNLHHVSYSNLYHERIKVDVFPLCEICHHRQHYFLWVFKLSTASLALKRRLNLHRAVHALTRGNIFVFGYCIAKAMM